MRVEYDKSYCVVKLMVHLVYVFVDAVVVEISVAPVEYKVLDQHHGDELPKMLESG